MDPFNHFNFSVGDNYLLFRGEPEETWYLGDSVERRTIYYYRVVRGSYFLREEFECVIFSNLKTTSIIIGAVFLTKIFLYSKIKQVNFLIPLRSVEYSGTPRDKRILV